MGNEVDTVEAEGTELEEPAPAASGRRKRGRFGLGVFLGLLTGAGLATLFTPFSGEDVRQRTAEKAPELWRRRDDLAREAATTVRSRLEEAIDAGREASREAQDESRRRFEKLTGRQPGTP